MAKKEVIARRYATTLMNAVSLDRMEGALRELRQVADVMRRSREISAALNSPLFSPGDKTAAVDVIAGVLKLSPELKKYLAHIAVEGATSVLDDILVRATAIYHDRKRRAAAQVITPVPFPTALGERLRAALGKITAREVEVEYVHDPALIGGVVVKIGSMMYDSSIKGQLRQLKDELIKG